MRRAAGRTLGPTKDSPEPMTGKKEGLVALPVTSWNHIVHSLQQIDLLRREGLFRAA